MGLSTRSLSVSGRKLLRGSKDIFPSVLPEEVIRCSLDFRHSRVETRTLLSIQSRVNNLFVEGQLQRKFLAELHELVRHTLDSTPSPLNQLLGLTMTLFPDITEAAQLSPLEQRFLDVLTELASIGDDEADLNAWRDRVLPVLDEIQKNLPLFLQALDRKCSCDVRTALEEALALRRHDLENAGVSVDSHCTMRSLGGLITRSDILFVFENLLTNAIRALKESPERRLTISVSRDAKRIRLECQDTGPGVPPEDRKRIFEPGFTTLPGGKGYGLARSRELLGHYGGSIELAATPDGNGATFVVTLRAVSLD